MFLTEALKDLLNVVEGHASPLIESNISIVGGLPYANQLLLSDEELNKLVSNALTAKLYSVLLLLSPNLGEHCFAQLNTLFDSFPEWVRDVYNIGGSDYHLTYY